MENQLLEKQKERVREVFASLPLPNFKHGLNIHSAPDFVFPFERSLTPERAPWKLMKQSGSVGIEDLALAVRRSEVARFIEDGKFLEAKDKIDAWNVLSASAGHYVRLEGECMVSFNVDCSKERHDQVIFHALPGSRAQVVIRYRGKPRRSDGTFQTERILAACEEGGTLSIVSLHEGGQPIVFQNRQAKVARDGKMEWNDFMGGAEFFSLRVNTELIGEGARVGQTLGYAGAGKAIADIDARILHRAPRTDSDMRMRLAASGQSRIVCQGTVVIDPRARAANGFQDIKGIIFDTAEIDPVPHLEIGNADVKCGHAVTVSPFDEETLFYLSSRGIGEADARKTLLKSFYRSLVGKNIGAATVKICARFIKKAVASMAS
ncbi:MAG: SufD family Fe-S cluster assembly protein [Patescibacteria group bacterium]